MLMCPSSALHRSSWNSQPYTSANVRRCSHSQLHLKGTSQMPLPRGTRFHRPACQHKAMASAIIEDRTLMVKMSLAKGSGRLDLSWLGLHEIPDEIFDLPDLEAGTYIHPQTSCILHHNLSKQGFSPFSDAFVFLAGANTSWQLHQKLAS